MTRPYNWVHMIQIIIVIKVKNLLFYLGNSLFDLKRNEEATHVYEKANP